MSAFSAPIFTVFNQGAVAPGAKVYTYLTGTSTPVTTYADANLATPNANPIVADANGQVVFFVPTTSNLRLGLYTADGAFIRTIDPVYPAATATGGSSTAEATIPSAATTDLGSAGLNVIKVTGTTGITSFGSSASLANPIFYVRFTGALTITNSASLSLPNGSNVTTANGSALIMEYLGSGNWLCLFYQTPSGTFLQPANNLGDVANAATALSNLGGVNAAYVTAAVAAGAGVPTTAAATTSTAMSFTVSSAAYTDITGLTGVTITPGATSQKVLVEGVVFVSSPVNQYARVQILRGATVVWTGSTFIANASGAFPCAFSFPDSPSSTSAQTYKAQISTNNAGSTTIYVNRDNAGTTETFFSSLNLMLVK